MDSEANKRICAFKERYSCNLQAIIARHKAGYTAIQVAGGWEGAVIRKSKQTIGQGQ